MQLLLVLMTFFFNILSMYMHCLYLLLHNTDTVTDFFLSFIKIIFFFTFSLVLGSFSYH